MTQPYSRTRIGPIVTALPAVTTADDGAVVTYTGKAYIVEAGAWVPLRSAASGTTPAATTWTSLTLTAGYAARGGGLNTPAYHRDATGRVHLRGGVNPQGGGVGVSGAAFATFPAGFRPVAIERLGVSADDTMARIEVGTDGAMRYAVGPAGTFITLDGLSFMAAEGPFTGTSNGTAVALTYALQSGANAWPNFTLTFPVAGNYLWTPHASCFASSGGPCAVQPRYGGAVIATNNTLNLESYAYINEVNTHRTLVASPAVVAIGAAGARTFTMTNQGNAATDSSDRATGTLVLVA